MNNSTTTEDGEAVQSEPNITTMFPQNVSGVTNSSASSPELPSPFDAGLFLTNSTNSTNSSNPFNYANNTLPNNNTTQQVGGGNETNSTDSGISDPLWNLIQNWNGSTFWDRDNANSFGGDNNTTNTTEITPTTTPGGPTTWEGYFLGVFCLGTAMLFILAPTWYMDRRRHLDFVSRSEQSREARNGRRRRRRRRRRRQRFMDLAGMIRDEEQRRRERSVLGQDDAETLLTEEYVLSMLVTRPIEASDLLCVVEGKKETPSLVNVVSDETDDTFPTATIGGSSSNNKEDHDMKNDDDDDDESYDDLEIEEEEDDGYDDLDPNEEEEDASSSSSIDDEDADCCAICLQDYKVGDEICYPTKSRPCCHQFHRGCLVPWLLKHNVCPCCRVQYLPLPLTPETETEMGDTEPEESEPMEQPISTGGSITGASAGLEMPPATPSPSLGGGDHDSDDESSVLRIDEEVGPDFKEDRLAEGDESSSSKPAVSMDVPVVDPPSTIIPLEQEEDPLPPFPAPPPMSAESADNNHEQCPSMDDSRTILVWGENESGILTPISRVGMMTAAQVVPTGEIMGCDDEEDESPHEKPSSLLDDDMTAPTNPEAALLDPSSSLETEMENGGLMMMMMAKEECGNGAQADTVDLEAQTHDLQRDSHDLLGNDVDDDDAPNVNLSVSITPERRFIRVSSEDETSFST
mmetsp:Transcript_34168/g.82828  ORF Transcript_34168/g.82828 Transcript_34168/m.82828 type:complete len:690 (-) Transcript_34168:28-2097(-)